METQTHIEYQGVTATEPVREAIAAHIEGLAKRFGRITACRVVLKGPGNHHQQGGLFDVHIRITMPGGREVIIGRTATADARRADLPFAINDAFKRARRQLQHQVRLLQGQTKAHAEQPIGKVMRLDDVGGFGFLESADGREIYFHRNSVANNAFASLMPGQRVTFFEQIGDKGPRASTVKPLRKHRLRGP
jgi:cold shock CspA family protein/ribosome-associated translation inhibitor RaiA